MKISDRIYELRKQKGLSQEQFAEKIGVTRQAVSKWESEQSVPDIDKVVIIANLFEVTTDYLLNGIEKEEKSSIEWARLLPIISTGFNFVGAIIFLFNYIIYGSWVFEYSPLPSIIFNILTFIFIIIGTILAICSPKKINRKSIRNYLCVNIWAYATVFCILAYIIFGSNVGAPYVYLFNIALYYIIVIFVEIILAIKNLIKS